MEICKSNFPKNVIYKISFKYVPVCNNKIYFIFSIRVIGEGIVGINNNCN